MSGVGEQVFHAAYNEHELKSLRGCSSERNYWTVQMVHSVRGPTEDISPTPRICNGWCTTVPSHLQGNMAKLVVRPPHN